MSENGQDLRKTKEWRDAERLFKEKTPTRRSFSLFGMGMVNNDTDNRLDQIEAICPYYYPVLFLRGEYMLRVGMDPEGEEYIEKAFESIFDIIDDEEEFIHEIPAETENLAKLLRYDLASKYMEKAVTLFPESAALYDYLAYYLLQQPGIDKQQVLENQEKALELEPDNDYFINNLGWIYMIYGEHEKAMELFRKAIDYSSDEHPDTENMDIAEYMQEHGINYLQYLLRPADMDEIRGLVKHHAVEEITDLCNLYNTDRLTAFKQYHVHNKTLPIPKILNTVHFVEAFLEAVNRNIDEDSFTIEDIFLFDHVTNFSHKTRNFIEAFIEKNDRVEDPLQSVIFDALDTLYTFMRDQGGITPQLYDEAKTQILRLKSITLLPPLPDTSWGTIREHLEKMSQEFPEYYKALFKWGEYMLEMGAEEAKSIIDKAFDILLSMEIEEDEIVELIPQQTDALALRFRFDLARLYIEKAIRLFPENAPFYDLLASYMIQKPGTDLNKTLEVEEKALELDPDNSDYLDRFGQIHMIHGDTAKAREYFEEALDADSGNEDASRHLEIIEEMEEQEISYFDYLMQPGDEDLFRELLDNDQFDDASHLALRFNTDKLDAFKMHTLKENTLPAHELFNIVQALEAFIDIMAEDSREQFHRFETIFLFDNIESLKAHGRYFIFRFLDHLELSNDSFGGSIFRSLIAFYRFYESRKLSGEPASSGLEQFFEELDTEFSGKLDQYYNIRSNYFIDDVQKEEMIRELFGF